MKYGRDFDFMKPFVEQFDDLMKDVPRASLHNINCDNSDYGNYLGGAKNCYMSFSG
jgi:hypothetical protein